MSADLDEIGPWTEEKLGLPSQYLAAQRNILATQNWRKRVHYIDAFTGGVKHLSKASGRIIEGSPLIPLGIDPPFSSYTFIEKNEDRVEKAIAPLKAQFPERDIRIERGDCNAILQDRILPWLARRRRDERGFIFLDPYGINLEWNTLAAIARTGMFDVLVNFCVMGVYRNMARGRPPLEAQKKRLDAVMGNQGWFREFYREDAQLSLFAGSRPAWYRVGEDISGRLAKFYQARLKTVFPHVSEYVIMLAPKGAPLYALMLASGAELAIKKMREIIRRIDKRGATWRRQA